MTRDEIAQEKETVRRNWRFKEGDGKPVRVRGHKSCCNSGRSIESGSIVFSQKVFPGDSNGRLMDLMKPKTFYFCGHCAECTH